MAGPKRLLKPESARDWSERLKQGCSVKCRAWIGVLARLQHNVSWGTLGCNQDLARDQGHDRGLRLHIQGQYFVA